MIGMNPQARAVIEKLTAAFSAPEGIADTVARAALIPDDRPCATWSLYNRLAVILSGTTDARGYRQWQEAGRFVKRGSKAVYILAPRVKAIGKRADLDDRDDDQDDDGPRKLTGFVGVPVFRMEDTDGEPLDYAPRQLPRLFDVAERLGVAVTYKPADLPANGYYSPQTEEIALHTHGARTFYHELAHAAHKRAGKLRDRGTTDAEAARADTINETVAEISAAALMSIYEGEETGAHAIRYVTAHGADAKTLAALAPEILEVVDIITSHSSAASVAA